MPAVRYRVFLDDEPATRDQLDRIEEIAVDQEIDLAWEARLKIPICADASGQWDGEDEPFLQSCARVRVEVKVGERSYVPLIDGPIVGSDRRTSSEPGQSSLLMIVHDDSAYLNRADEIRNFQNMSDHEIARQLFNDTTPIARVDVENALPCTCGITPEEIQRGTRMALLRRLARRQGMHAYVLPGDSPGQSVGCFKKLPITAGDLPEMVLLGGDRNITSFNVSNNAQRAANVQSSSLAIGDRTVTESTSSIRNVELLGSEGTSDSDAGTRILRPDADCCLEPERAAAIESERTSYSFEASGAVLSECYGAALAPYHAITVRAVGSRLSGTYVIKKVEHRLDRWRYSQQFALLRNARSGGSAGGGLLDLAASIF